MCANMRKVGKKKAGVWLTEEERELLKAVSSELRVSQSEILRQAIIEAARVVKTRKGRTNG